MSASEGKADALTRGETYKLRLLSKLELPGYIAKFTPAGPYDLDEQQSVTGQRD
jgi:hypothetical protein